MPLTASSQVLFRCVDRCPVIGKNDAEAGFIIPDDIVDLRQRQEIVEKQGLTSAGRCLRWRDNGARLNESRGPTGYCFLKGGKERPV